MKPLQMAFNFDGLMFSNPESTLTKQERKVYDLIPTGKENAVPVDYISKTLTISSRHVIELVRKLRLKSLDIGSTQSNGYYKFKNLEEYSEFIARYKKKQVRSNHVLEALKRTPMAQKLLTQTNGNIKNEEKKA
ncbi:transcriptional regulator [Lactobacillus crispatus]|uniref:hypothetical protein n=1 Tax=Lactobacillus crispatus TaxID=47770 RepID=UPI001238C4A1|nr:hypothetical protein [Lactobacillus crispatus]KAA8809230.1 hypothetical protein F1C08_08085 [Lactobacillus crispatus]